jgi:hypothetical protein
MAYAQNQRVVSIEKKQGHTDYIVKTMVCGNFPSLVTEVRALSQDTVLVEVIPATVGCRNGERPYEFVSHIGSVLKAGIMDLNLDPKNVKIFFSLD